MPVINRAAPWRLMPHQDAMCLLDAVEESNDTNGLHTNTASPDVKSSRRQDNHVWRSAERRLRQKR